MNLDYPFGKQSHRELVGDTQHLTDCWERLGTKNIVWLREQMSSRVNEPNITEFANSRIQLIYVNCSNWTWHNNSSRSQRTSCVHIHLNAANPYRIVYVLTVNNWVA